MLWVNLLSAINNLPLVLFNRSHKMSVFFIFHLLQGENAFVSFGRQKVFSRNKSFWLQSVIPIDFAELSKIVRNCIIQLSKATDNVFHI